MGTSLASQRCIVVAVIRTTRSVIRGRVPVRMPHSSSRRLNTTATFFHDERGKAVEMLSAKFMRWAELTRIVVEIIAVFVGAWWAYSRFFVKEAPLLEEHGSVESSLEWMNADEERCTAVLGITIKNPGKRSFN